jgi:AcrR family transcriptional regulator
MSSMNSSEVQLAPVVRKQRRTGDETRTHLLSVAYQLFYNRGIHSVGVDEIARTAEVAPTTMYRSFESKDALVGAYASAVDDYWRAWFTKVTATETDPAGQIRAVFAALGEVFQSPEHRGCPFMMLLAEYPDARHPAHTVAVENKQWARQQFSRLCHAANFLQPEQIADQLTVVLDGMYANNQSLGSTGPVLQGQSLVELILSSSAVPEQNHSKASNQGPPDS